jgi:general secretion pathway protein G
MIRRGKRNTMLVWLRARGVTLAEMAIALAIVAVVAFVAVPKYQDYQSQLRVTQAIYDLGDLNFQLQQRMDETKNVPNDLGEIGQKGKKDPWGRSYVYTPLSGPNAGKARKNKSLHPINTYFDLYSVGADGQSNLPLTSGPSQDDIIVANDGRFIGMAKDYE